MNGINRIFPFSMSFGVGRHSRSTDREPQQGGSYSGSKKERQPNEEEAKKALAILLEMESIRKNHLKVELETDSASGTNVYVLSVKDQAGNLLRGLRGSDILRLLEQGAEKANHPESGRIIDRRI